MCAAVIFASRAAARLRAPTAAIRRPLPVALACMLVALGGCGKSLRPTTGEGTSAHRAPVSPAGAGGLVTKNTTRLGGSSAAVDAAAVARTVYPAADLASRPQAVVLADEHDWPAALVASVLAGPPLRAPLLYSQGIVLPAVSATTLERLAPAGASALGGIQAIRVGRAAAPPQLRLRAVDGPGPAALAVAMERLVSEVQRRPPRRLIVTASEAPPAMTAPAASLAAQSSTPILFVGRATIPAATLRELRRLGQTSIYVLGPPTVVSARVVKDLERFGPVRRIGAAEPAANAIAVARFSDGSFGWGVREPGHGFVFADTSRPFDATAAALLSASGDYAPLLLLDGAGRIGAPLAHYVADLQPGSPPSGPVRGVYNHGWLIGDEDAIPLATQVQLDAMLEISSTVSGSEPALSPSTEASEP
jgi:hypothetical protein